MNKIYSLNIVRIGLITCIVLYHSCLFWTGNWFTSIHSTQDAPFLSYLANWLRSFNIYGFVFLSGYLYYYLKNENDKYKKYLPFIKTKALRLLLPYIAIAFLWNIPFALYFSKDLSSLLKQYLLGTSPGQLWFLLMLFMTFVLFHIIEKIPFFYKGRKLSFISLCVCIGIYAIGIIGLYIFPNYFQIWTACNMLLFFYFGSITRSGQIDKFLSDKNFTLFLLGILQVVLFILSGKLNLPNLKLQKIILLIINLFCHLLGAFVSFKLLFKLGKHMHPSSIINKLSDLSFGIYLFHQQIIFICLSFMVNKINPYLTTLLCFICSYILSAMMTYLLLKTRYTRWIVGSK